MRNGSERKRTVEVLELGEGKQLVAELRYNEGGINYFSSLRELRGYYLSVRPETVKDGCRSFLVGRGTKALVAEAKRFSAGTLAKLAVPGELAEKLKAHVLADPTNWAS